MKTLGLDHYNLCAPRELLEELRKFYVEAVGLTVGYRPPFRSPGFWLYAGEQPVLHLSESEKDMVVSESTVTTFDHVAFSCTGSEEFEQKLTRLGIDYERFLIPDLERVQLFFSDPAGNGIELNFPDE